VISSSFPVLDPLTLPDTDVEESIQKQYDIVLHRVNI